MFTVTKILTKNIKDIPTTEDGKKVDFSKDHFKK
jgi:hypothetical protein